MGLRGKQRPSGLACLLFDSPREGGERVTALDAQRLASDLQAAVEYVFHGGGGAAAVAGSGAPPLIVDGAIDYDAVAQHVQRAVHAAAGLPLAGQAAAEQQQAEAQPGERQQAQGQQAQEQQHAGGSGSAGSAGGDQSPDQPPRLVASDSSGSEAASPVAAPSAAAAPAAGAAARSSGRLGPAEVGLVEARGTCEVNGTHVLSRSNFATVRSNACVFRGRWQYEVQLGSAGIMQLGWTTLAARFNSEEGVGDNHDSYAYDGRRLMRWHSSNNAYGEHWAAGDVVGCCLDLDAGTMRFYRNGRDLGEAFANVRRGMPGMAYFAGVSLSYAERCEVNFGGRPFLHPVEGYEPLQQQVPDRYQQLAAAALGAGEQPQQQEEGQGAPGAPRLSRQQEVAVARYLAGCLSRLMDVSAPARAADQAGSRGGGRGGGPSSEHVEAAAVEEAGEEAADMLAREQAVLFPAAAGPLLSAAGRLPDADLLAALAAAAGEPGSSKPAAPAGGLAPAMPAMPAGSMHGGRSAGPAICIDERVLLGALLAQHLGPLCFDPYIAEVVLMPLLDDTAGELAGGGTNISGKVGEAGSPGGDGIPEQAQAAGEAADAAAEPDAPAAAGPGRGAVGDEGVVQELGRARLAQLLELLAAVLEPEEVAALATHCCQVLGRRVRGCLWSLAELPRSDALGALRLWSAVLECQAFREAWLASGEWQLQLEQLMCVRQPSEEDLIQLFGNLKVVWSEGGAGVVRNRREDQSTFSADLNNISGGLEQQRSAQQALLQPQQGHYLRQWLQHLIDKNHGAMRHVPPPGLSDQTALVSTVFALLRLMNEQVSASLPEVPTLRWDPASTFLTGGALGGGDDPYWDAGRVGGTLSHLAHEHPPTEEDRKPLEGLPVGAVVKYDAALRLEASAKERPSFADVWLRDRLLMLCHLSAAPLMRGGLSHLASMQAAMAGLRAVSAEGGGRMMEETRRQCQQEFVRSLRSHEWAQCWLLSPWRQQAAFVLAVGTAQLLEAVSEQRQGLLRYVPELYVSTCLDMVHAVHRCEPAVLNHAAMLGLGLRHIIKFVVFHLEDERIVSPEVQSRLLHMVLDGVQELDLLRELGGNPVSRSRLVPAMMRLFGRPQLWGPVSNFFALLVEGSGFLHPPPAYPSEFKEPLDTLRRLFTFACLADADLCERFTHHLFDNANRMLTELVASLESMESSWTRGAGPSLQLLRLLSSTADYALVLLRVVELMAVEMPQLFLEGSDMNLTRLAEVVGFAVPQFVSGRAHRALQRVAADRLAAQLRLREAHLLQPLSGALVALREAEHAQHAQQEAQQQLAAAGAEQALQAQRRRQSLARALDRQAALTDDILRGLLDVELSQVEPLSAEAAAAAVEAASEGGESPADQRRRHEEHLRKLRDTVDGLLRHRAEAAAAAAARGGGGGGGGALPPAAHTHEQAEAPEEFLDPILQTLMQDPVLLPDSRITLDRATIERHLLSSATDPFRQACRAPLTKEQLVPNTELRQQIETWLLQEEQGGGGSAGGGACGGEGGGDSPGGSDNAGAEASGEGSGSAEHEAGG
ncbi:hypothetical protein ABPG75_009511 [Micractinium tetrahymenae]